MDFLTRQRPSSSRGERDHLRRQRGVASVEMIVVLPVLLVLLFGTIEFGFIFRQQMVLFRAADVAARTLILVDDHCTSGTLISEATTAGEEMLGQAGVDGDINLEDGDPCMRGTVTMTASSEYESIVLGALVPALDRLDLSASSVQRTFQ